TMLSSTGGPPPARTGHATGYDPLRHEMLIFGGWSPPPSGPGLLNDFWSFALSSPESWTTGSAGGAPDPRRFVRGLYDTARDRLLIFGGQVATSSALADLWQLDRTAVTAVPSAAVARPHVGLAWPNPFHDETHLTMELPESGRVRIAVYDVAGRLTKEVV